MNNPFARYQDMSLEEFEALTEFERAEIVADLRQALPAEFRDMTDEETLAALLQGILTNQAGRDLAQAVQAAVRANMPYIRVHAAKVLLVLKACEQMRRMFGDLTHDGQVGPSEVRAALDAKAVNDLLSEL